MKASSLAVAAFAFISAATLSIVPSADGGLSVGHRGSAGTGRSPPHARQRCRRCSTNHPAGGCGRGRSWWGSCWWGRCSAPEVRLPALSAVLLDIFPPVLIWINGSN